MKFPLVWLLPPLVGALIGYVTNAVAIKMLFRPLKAVKVFGIRLPFTPGILPRQRHKLADSIGTMVERELFTPEIIKARLRHPDVNKRIRESITLYTEKKFNVPLAQIIHPPCSPDGPPSAGTGFRELLIRLTLAFIKSPAFISLLDKLFSALANSYGNRTLRDIMEQAGILEHNVEGVVQEAIRFSAPGLQNTMSGLAEQAGPVLMDALIQFLKREDMHREMEIRGRVFLNKTILKLNVFQRFFISAGQYDKTLHERMPEIIDDLILELEHIIYDEEVNRRTSSFLKETCGNFFTAQESSGALSQRLTKLILAYLDRPLEELIRHWTNTDFSGLSKKIIFRIQEQEGLDIKIGLALDHFFEKHREMSLAELFSVDAEKKEKINALVCDKILQIMDEQIESLLESIDIRTLVSNRIDSLDMIRVEGIILDVMANQLKWINFFGAILGALIGVFQSVFSWFLT